MTPIRTKLDMYRLLNAGRLGHTLPAAETLADAERLVKLGGTWVVRSKEAGGKTVFGLEPAAALALVRGMREGSWNLSPMLSDPHRVCYAHLLDGPGGWSLHYSDEPKACRLKQLQDGCPQKNLTGLAARLYLRGIMDQPGWDTLNTLVDAYPDHVIEFTVMTSSLEAFGPSNVIIWEVRCTTGEYERGSGWEYGRAAVVLK